MSYEVFPEDELQRRLAAVRRVMKQLGLDALLVSVPEMDPDWLTTLLEERGVDDIGEAAKSEQS